MNKNLPARKNIRLREYDYSKSGCYFITICVNNMDKLLGNIVGNGVLDVPAMRLSKYGRVAEKYIISINSYYKHIEIEKYVIMPNHIHMLLLVDSEKRDGTSKTPSPTNAILPSLISTFKRFVHKECGISFFQRSYYDRIIRNEHEYKTRWKYIDENPQRWENDIYYI